MPTKTKKRCHASVCVIDDADRIVVSSEPYDDLEPLPVIPGNDDDDSEFLDESKLPALVGQSGNLCLISAIINLIQPGYRKKILGVKPSQDMVKNMDANLRVVFNNSSSVDCTG